MRAAYFTPMDHYTEIGKWSEPVDQVWNQLPASIRTKLEFMLESDLHGMRYTIHLRPIGRPDLAREYVHHTSHQDKMARQTIILPDEFIAYFAAVV
jgi:hypothetical protein